MPDSLDIAVFVLGAILILLAIVGGGFKIFGFETSSSINNRWLRFFCLTFGVILLILALDLKLPLPDQESPTPTQTPLPPGILNEKCNEGLAPKTILQTDKENYFQGEPINVEFINACANKTILVVKSAGYTGSKLNTGDRQNSTLLRQSAGEVTIKSDRLGVKSYEIQAYFTPNGRNHFITGVSNIFTMVSRL